MDAVLTRQLTVVVGRGMERDMRIGQIMAYLRRKFQDALQAALSHGFY
jgi:hypothetical protein